jgi:hypothetical protein
MPQRHGRSPCTRPMSSCAAWSTASSTWMTSRRMSCPPGQRPGLDGPHARISTVVAHSFHELDRHRELVAAGVRQAAGWRRKVLQNRQLWRTQGGNGRPRPIWLALLEQSARSASVSAWHCVQHHPLVLALRDDARVNGWCGWYSARPSGLERTAHVSEEAALRITDWIEPLLRRESYLALLLERPSVHERLLRLLGAARWPARYLLQHPGVIDELASDAMLAERFQRRAISSAKSSTAATPCSHRRGRRRVAAESAAPRPPRRGLSHAGARCGRPPERGAGGRRPERAGRHRDAANHRALVLAALAQPPPRGAALSPSSATASSVARSSVTAAIWTLSLCTKTTTSRPARCMPPLCAS